MKLTESNVLALECGARRVVWDSEVPGFGVRVGKRKSWIVVVRDEHGRQRWVTLGKVGIMTVREAREEARAILRAAVRRPVGRPRRYPSRYPSECSGARVLSLVAASA